MNIANRCISTTARLRAEKLLKELTLEEKVRQLGCTTLQHRHRTGRKGLVRRPWRNRTA